MEKKPANYRAINGAKGGRPRKIVGVGTTTSVYFGEDVAAVLESENKTPSQAIAEWALIKKEAAK